MEITKEYIENIFNEFRDNQVKIISEFIPDQMFQDFMNIPHGLYYEMFRQLGLGWDFPDYFNIYSHLRYCIDDDGEASFVKVVLNRKMEIEGLPTRNIKSLEFFAVQGHFMELNTKTLFDLAVPYYKNEYSLVEYHSCIVDEQLFSKICEYGNIMLTRTYGAKQGVKFDLDEHNRNNKIEAEANLVLSKYIEENRYNFKGVNNV